MTKKMINCAKINGGCNKFSTRFLYENLIDGTAISGSAYEQNRSLSKCSATTPLTAAGTFLPSVDGKKVYENLLQLSLALRKVHESGSIGKYIAVSVLAAVLSTCMVSESWATPTCDTGKKACQTGCIDESLTCNSCGSTCGYTLVDGSVTLYGNGEAVSGYTWKTVNGLLGAYDINNNLNPFYKNTSITSVKADESSNFTSIGNYAFREATSLQSVDMPNVTSIGQDAFNTTTSLQSVDMPNVTSIGAWAFLAASSLTSIDMPKVTTLGGGAFQNATSLQSVNMPNVNTINGEVFRYAKSLESIDLSNVTAIGSMAFYQAYALESIDLSNVTSIGSDAFSGASSLTNIIIPDDVNVNNWSANAFGGLASGAKITCWGDENTCYQKLRKYFSSSDCPDIPNLTCTCSSNCISSSVVQFPTAEQCSASESYYSTNNGCVKLPTTQDNCTSAGFSWVSDKCTKNAPANTEPDSEPQGQGGSQASEQQESQVSGSVSSASECVANGKYWQEGTCVSSCGPSFKLNDGWCDRQRYTPAEAAAILNDDDNEITITFKK